MAQGITDNTYAVLSDRKGISAPEAEQAVIGGVLIDPSSLPRVMEILKPESFFIGIHRDLFSILMQMFSEAKTEDVITVVDESVRRGVFETSSMAKNYLGGLMDGVPSTANIETYCKIVDEKYKIRRLVDVAESIISQTSEGTSDAASMLDIAEQSIYDIRNGEIRGLSRLDSILIDVFDRLQEISGENKEEFRSLSSGFRQLDEITNGLNNSDLIIVAARPAVGKSAFVINTAVNACKRSGKAAAIFSLEMAKEQIASRMLSSEALVNNNTLRSGNISGDEWVRLVESTDTLAKLPIYIDDGAGLTVPQMKAKLRRVNDLGLVVIDYLQLMESPNKHTSRVNEVSEITRQLKLMAKELNVPVIACSQLSRNAEKRDDKRPLLSDLRESGSIEQDADIIEFLYRDAYYDATVENLNAAECIVAKNRHGQTSTVHLSYIGEYTLFRGIDMRRNEN